MKTTEKDLRIPLPDGHMMYARLRGSLNRPVVLLVHGLTGHMDEHLFFNGARAFEKKGISSLRINLYSWEKGARSLTDCTLNTHAKDVNTALAYLCKHGAKKIFAVGHSYGAPSIMLADQKLIDGYILWDGSYELDFKKAENGGKPLSKKRLVLNWGMEIIAGVKMRDVNNTLDWDAMASDIEKPLLAIYAGDNSLRKGALKYERLAKGPSKAVRIPGAGHTFDEAGTEEKLFEETVKWVKKYS
jgi:pimeloyl-ACP methyl ester carboxylesterase